jgi:hypothetical protein
LEDYRIAEEDPSLPRRRPARLVDVSLTSCTCPNCGDKLRPLLLDEAERKRVRVGLMKVGLGRHEKGLGQPPFGSRGACILSEVEGLMT